MKVIALLGVACIQIPRIVCFHHSSILSKSTLRSFILRNSVQQNDYEMVTAIKKALVTKPDDEPLLFNLGLLLVRILDDTKLVSDRGPLMVEAISAFGKAVKINPNRDASWFNIANLKEVGGDNYGAVSAYKETVKVSKNTVVLSAAYNNIMQILLENNDLEEAASICNQAVIALPDDPTAWANMGIVLRKNGDQMEWAESCFLNSVQFSNGLNSVALNNLGSIYTMKNEIDKAVDVYRQAIEIDEYDDLSTYSLAMLYRDAGDLTLSREMFMRCLEINPSNSAAKFQLSALVGDSDVDQCPPKYIEELFDHYSKEGYDTHMVENLKYKVPDFLWDAYMSSRNIRSPTLADANAATSSSNTLENDIESLNIVELGAGTGLVGTRFRAGFSELKKTNKEIVDVVEFTAIDLSSLMIVQAYNLQYNVTYDTSGNAIDSNISPPESFVEVEESVYTDVVVQDCSSYLEDRIEQKRDPADLILAGDVLVYIGKLDQLFKNVFDAMRVSGRFIFSVEKLMATDRTNVGYVLQESARFAHTKEYIEEMAKKVGLKVFSCSEVPLRYDGGKAVNGYVFVLTRID